MLREDFNVRAWNKNRDEFRVQCPILVLHFLFPQRNYHGQGFDQSWELYSFPSGHCELELKQTVPLKFQSKSSGIKNSRMFDKLFKLIKLSS